MSSSRGDLRYAVLGAGALPVPDLERGKFQPGARVLVAKQVIRMPSWSVSRSWVPNGSSDVERFGRSGATLSGPRLVTEAGETVHLGASQHTG